MEGLTVTGVCGPGDSDLGLLQPSMTAPCPHLSVPQALQWLLQAEPAGSEAEGRHSSLGGIQFGVDPLVALTGRVT
jgi:hypothetical protein